MVEDQQADIVARLRLLQSGAAWVCNETASTLEEAADEIARLRAELSDTAGFLCFYENENARLRAENARLLKTLRDTSSRAMARAVSAKQD